MCTCGCSLLSAEFMRTRVDAHFSVCAGQRTSFSYYVRVHMSALSVLVHLKYCCCRSSEIYIDETSRSLFYGFAEHFRSVRNDLKASSIQFLT